MNLRQRIERLEQQAPKSRGQVGGRKYLEALTAALVARGIVPVDVIASDGTIIVDGDEARYIGTLQAVREADSHVRTPRPSKA
jgi:hypothetical protein